MKVCSLHLKLKFHRCIGQLRRLPSRFTPLHSISRHNKTSPENQGCETQVTSSPSSTRGLPSSFLLPPRLASQSRAGRRSAPRSTPRPGMSKVRKRPRDGAARPAGARDSVAKKARRKAESAGGGAREKNHAPGPGSRAVEAPSGKIPSRPPPSYRLTTCDTDEASAASVLRPYLPKNRGIPR